MLPGSLGFFQFLRNFRQRNAFEQAELILYAALAPTVASVFAADAVSHHGAGIALVEGD